MQTCALLTIDNTEGWFIDDHLLHEPLHRLGWQAEDVPWTAKTDWDRFDAVVIRSPWDYQQNVPRFLEVLKQIENSRAKLFNPLSIVKWNLDKHYLFDLQRRGVEIVPTLRLESPIVTDIESAFHRFETAEVVLKPSVGANADDTFRISATAADSNIQQACECFRGRTAFLQPFQEAIVTEGEFSVMYFAGKFSHAILKTVGENDFRVQEEHGGGVLSVVEPDELILKTADQVIEVLDDPLLYARVDLVRTPQNRFALMELELIEPCLYFRFDEHAADRFAKAQVEHFEG